MMSTQFINNKRRVEIKAADAYETFVDVLRERAADMPDVRAYAFLADGEDAEVNLTYGELDMQARAIAAVLQAVCSPGDRALLVYEPGLPYIAAWFGCLYAGVVAVPAYPPDPMRLEKTLPRLQVIVQDSDPAVVLASSMVMPLQDFFKALHPAGAATPWVDTERVDVVRAEAWRPPDITGDTIAFLQYTSGSTSEPRGVMVTHRNLLENVATSCVLGKYTEDDAFVSWLPQYHDMGLIGGILQPLYGGFLGVLMSPMSFLQRPFRWLRAISKYRGKSSAFPNFALELCAKKVTDEQKGELDLSCWKIAVNGSEPLRPDSVERFSAAFALCGFDASAHCPGYGLAEATLIVTFSAPTRPARFIAVDGVALEQHHVVTAFDDASNIRRFMGCGGTLGDMQVRIVNPDTGQVYPPNEVGEIWVRGSSLAKGYWNRPAETEAMFHAVIAGDNGGAHYLRTGDLGFLQDGELFVTGRIKDMIIVDGANHYPQDIEATVESAHPALRAGCSAAFAIDGNGMERLVIAAEIAPDADADRVRGAVRQKVAAQHDLRVHDVVFLKSRSIPKTSSGKLQRHACRAAYAANTLDTV
ncbi:MAG: fatty acyl-AMP ligase [Candidatus Hydrogenedentales bacterium]